MSEELPDPGSGEVREREDSTARSAVARMHRSTREGTFKAGEEWRVEVGGYFVDRKGWFLTSVKFSSPAPMRFEGSTTRSFERRSQAESESAGCLYKLPLLILRNPR